MNQYAKEAMKRLSSGFYRVEKNIKKAKIESQYGDEDDELYNRVKRVLLSHESEKALSILIEKDELDTMDDAGKERYIINLSAKLQEFKNRFRSEQEYNLVEDTISV